MSKKPKFTIRRLTEAQGKPSPAKDPQPTPQQPSSETTTSKTPASQRLLDSSTGGHFGSANHVLAFLGSVLGTRLSDAAVVRRAPQGKWWTEVAVSHERIAPLIWTAGGRPFARHHQQWVKLSLSGELPTQDQDTQTLDVSTWSIVELAELLAEASLPPSRYQKATILEVVTPGSLGRWILGRATALGLEVTLTSASQQPLDNNHNNNHQESSGVLLIRLQSDGNRTIPAALVHRLTSLPYTTVAVPVLETERARILLDVRHRLPLTPSLIEPMIPEDEIWVLGTADLGHWRLRTIGNQIDGGLLLDAPQLPKAKAPSLVSNRLPKPIAVQLVPRPRPSQKVDAVLLDDTELSWVRSLLMGRPVGEMAFLLPGAGYHLLTAPGGLPTQIPLGIPLIWIGPSSLYLELGMDFYPSLPNGARQQRFNLNSKAAVVVARNQTYRFNIAEMTPAWTLWVGEVPQVKAGLSKPGKQLLNSISKQLRQRETKPWLQELFPPKPDSTQEVGTLEQAQQAELKGDLVKAAALLENAGYSAQAGRLYERIGKRRGR